jgi:hypothetical protein
VDRVRVTRTGRSVAVGKLEPPDLASGTAHLVPSLSVWDCSAALRWSGPARPDVVRGSTAVLATPFKFSGYWHWIHEGLLPLLTLERGGLLATLDHVLICLDGGPPRHVVDSLRVTGLARDNIQITSEPFDLAVERFVLTARPATGGLVDDRPPGAARPSPDAAMEDHAASLAELRVRMDVPSEPGRRRIYVSRSDAAKRRVSNEGPLIEALHRRGFECMTLTDLSFGQQVALFREAGVVIGPHGAGLTNIAFSAAGTAVLELEQRADRRRYFERLAARIGARYASVTCPPDADAPQDMVADIGEVLSVLDRLVDR